jgi:dihydrofolate reductase / thymidylate synthase
MKSISLIVAIDQNYGIGKNGSIPWHSSRDLQQFAKLTTGHTVIMGRKTWKSLPPSKRPLPNRRNVVISASGLMCITDEKDGVDKKTTIPDVVYNNIESAIKSETARITNFEKQKVFIIGGASLYNYCLTHPLLREIYVTTLNDSYDCDTFIDQAKLNDIIQPNNNLINHSHSIRDRTPVCYTKSLLYSSETEYSCKYSLSYHGEDNYTQLAHGILMSGNERTTRNAVVLSQFGKRLEYDLRNGFPLLTTKRMFWRGIVEELLWFLRGDTNVKHLKENGVHIWDGNTSRQFLDANGMTHLKEYDGGAIYSHQWRHFNAEYVDCDTNYTGKGYDQIADCIDQIQHNPTSRRIMFSAWNPSQFKDMSLLPCHVSYQFYVDVDSNELSCMMTQRSADVFLGLPFNIASTALLTTLIAHHCDLKPSRIIINLGDTHIYGTHRGTMLQQLKNAQYGFPRVEIKCKKERIEDYTFDDMKLCQYYSHPAIKADMIP